MIFVLSFPSPGRPVGRTTRAMDIVQHIKNAYEKAVYLSVGVYDLTPPGGRYRYRLAVSANGRGALERTLLPTPITHFEPLPDEKIERFPEDRRVIALLLDDKDQVMLWAIIFYSQERDPNRRFRELLSRFTTHHQDVEKGNGDDLFQK